MLSLSVAAHVADEALTGFLDAYNPTVRALRARLGWLPMPVFTFEVWLGGLCALVIVLLALSPLAFRRTRVARVMAYPYATSIWLVFVARQLTSVLPEFRQTAPAEGGVPSNTISPI